jgi:predicted  nucleic acid-binding Zn-ribbon protein
MRHHVSDYRFTPNPPDYESAIREIYRLQNQLISTNEKWAKARLDIELNKRSARGTIKAMQEEIDRLRAKLAEVTKSQEANHG